jgi:trk system potassium uptake protein TrkA
VRVHVVIVGCGRVGSGLAMALQRDGHSVSILDTNPRAFRRLTDAFTGQKLVGSGFDRDDLEAAGAVGADALAAVTSGDNRNILAVRIAREHYGIARVVARIYDPRRAEIYQRLGIPTVATVRWTIDQVHRSLVPDQQATEWVDATAGLVLVERRLPEDWAGRVLTEVEEHGKVKLVAVVRAGVPRLDTRELVGQEGDVLHIAVASDSLHLLGDRLGTAVAVAIEGSA